MSQSSCYLIWLASDTEINHNELIPGPKRLLTVCFYCNAWVSIQLFPLSHTTTVTSYTGLRVNQIPPSSLNTDRCWEENLIIWEANNLFICNGTGCQKLFCYRGVVPSFLFWHASPFSPCFCFEPSFPSSSVFQDCAETSTSVVWSCY